MARDLTGRGRGGHDRGPTMRQPGCPAPGPENRGIMSNAETITVPHLGTSTIGYKLGTAYDASLPTLVMVNSFTTSVEQYRPQFADETLTATANLLAIEPYGHGQTRASYAQFTYWDSAIANLQVLDALDIPAAFVLGTSQGGWIAARMAIVAPDVVRGIVPL